MLIGTLLSIFIWDNSHDKYLLFPIKDVKHFTLLNSKAFKLRQIFPYVNTFAGNKSLFVLNHVARLDRICLSRFIKRCALRKIRMPAFVITYENTVLCRGREIIARG